MRFLRPIPAVLLALGVAISAPAAAQDPPDDRMAPARIEVRAGLEALEAGRFEEALEHFESASKLVPEANLPHKHAARALEGLGRWKEAVAEYERYLRIKADVSDAAAIRARIDEIKAKHLEGSVRFDCTPADAEVSVDGTRVALTTGRGTTRLAAGDHHVRIVASGYLTKESDVRVTAGEEQPVPCALERMQATLFAGPENKPPPEKPPSATPWYGRWWVWATVGVVVAGAGVTTFVLTRSDSGPPGSEGGDHRFP